MYVETLPDAIDQGVILSKVYFYSNDQWLHAFVLTPTCDFAQNKVDYVQVCAALPAWDVVSELLDGQWSKTRRDDLPGRLKDIISQKIPRYHWLKPWSNSSPYILDFQIVTSCDIDELTSEQIVTGLASPYREQIPARYAAYMGRVGTEDFTKKEIEAWVHEGKNAFSSRWLTQDD